MGDAKNDLVRQWLLKSDHDLASAEKLSGGESPLLDTAIYHCQQAAEKALKGFLVFHDQRFEKTHDLEILINLSKKYRAEFKSLDDAGEILTPYATIYRYPGELIVPNNDEFNEAMETAKRVVTFVKSVLPL